ncbi:MAG: hypothetical protein Q9204_001267 [Flavoplaca sp. TL-2023a]
MSFRMNFDISLSFPPPPPRSGRPLPASDGSHIDSSEEVKRGFPGWLQTARQHPRYSLRLLYFLTAIAGLILVNLVSGNVWHSYRIVDLHRMAFAPLIIGLLWQLITLYDKRLFHGRQVPNWAIAIVETLGFLAYLALFVGNRLELIDESAYYNSSWALNEWLLIAYDSAVWIILCLVHAILAIQCYAQGWMNVRPKRVECADYEHGHNKGKGRAADDEEPLLGSGEAEGQEGQAGPSEQTASTPYRDEVEHDENT